MENGRNIDSGHADMAEQHTIRDRVAPYGAPEDMVVRHPGIAEISIPSAVGIDTVASYRSSEQAASLAPVAAETAVVEHIRQERAHRTLTRRERESIKKGYQTRTGGRLGVRVEHVFKNRSERRKPAINQLQPGVAQPINLR